MRSQTNCVISGERGTLAVATVGGCPGNAVIVDLSPARDPSVSHDPTLTRPMVERRRAALHERHGIDIDGDALAGYQHGAASRFCQQFLQRE